MEARALEWTWDTPAKPGFYWCHQNGQTRMVEVWGYRSEANQPGRRLFTSEDGGAVVDDINYYGAAWYGPIEPPGYVTPGEQSGEQSTAKFA